MNKSTGHLPFLSEEEPFLQFIDVTKSRFDDLNNEYINYQPTRRSLVDARLMFVRKTADNNMVGVDHGYADGSTLRRIA